MSDPDPAEENNPQDAARPGARARARYARAYRLRNPGYDRRRHLRASARGEVLEILARRHPAEFAELYAAALRRRGVDPVAMERPCPCGGIIRRTAPIGRWPAKCGDCRRSGGEDQDSPQAASGLEDRS